MESNTLAPLRVLQILQKYSDREHKLTHQDIIDMLDKKFGISSERKKITRILTNLESAGYAIERTKSGCYMDSLDFDESEIRYLIESVLFSKHIPAKQANDLIKKIKELSNVYYEDTFGKVYNANTISRTTSQDLLYNLSITTEALNKNKMIEFYYNEYDTDKKLHKVFDEKITATPLRIVCKNDNYYVICKPDYCNKYVNYRLDKITDIIISVKDILLIENIELNKYLSSHPSMFVGGSEEIIFKASKQLVGEIIDTFGMNFSIVSEGEYEITVKLYANLPDMEDWARKFGDRIEILSPQILRKKMFEFSIDVNKTYIHDKGN